MARAEADLKAHVATRGLASTSSCNTNAITCDLPVLGDGFNLAPSTQTLLRKLAAVPALVEAHGWARPLRMPPLLQCATYAAAARARYAPHFDSNPWEQHNRREITVLLYLNVGWDAAAHGGCLRVHPPDGVNEPPVDVSPVAGRLVLFHSRLTKHEVLPCTSGERVAVTLWVEYGED